MNNPSPNEALTFDFHPQTPTETPSERFHYYQITYKGPLSRFYERLLASNLMDIIVDFTVDTGSHQAFICLAWARPEAFWCKYSFIKQSEVWRPTTSVKLMSMENSYRYFHGKCIKNDPEWVKERMEMFAGRTGWNFQDLLYYEDEHFEEICKNLKAEERKVQEDTKSRDSVIGGRDDFTTKDTDDGSDVGAPTEKQEIARRFPRKDDEEKETDIEELEMRDSRKKIKVGSESKSTEKMAQEEEKAGDRREWREQEGVVKGYGKSGAEEDSENREGFPDVMISINTCHFELEDELTSECTCGKGKMGLEGIEPIRVGGDIQKLSMYGYMDDTYNKEPCRR